MSVVALKLNITGANTKTPQTHTQKRRPPQRDVKKGEGGGERVAEKTQQRGTVDE